MKKILVSTDASEYSKEALKSALELARKFDVEIELLFVMFDPIVYKFSEVDSYISPQQVERDGELVLKSTLEGIDISGITLTTKKLYGDPGNVIIQETKNENIDLVVMGSRGHGAIVGSLLGSVSLKVLHGAKCAVLIVK